jgi:hypothetical protein
LFTLPPTPPTMNSARSVPPCGPRWITVVVSQSSAACTTTAGAPCCDCTFAASVRTVGFWNSVEIGISTPNCFFSWSNRRTASSEWPPRSKKLASAPTCFNPSSSHQIATILVSIGPSGASSPAARSLAENFGNARRSTLPLWFSGIASTTL